MSGSIDTYLTPVILCAGHGKRILDHIVSPKCLVVVNGRTILEHNLFRLHEAGFQKAYVICKASDKGAFETVVRGLDFISVVLIVDNESKGQGGSLNCLKGYMGDMSWFFLIMNGDTLVDIDIKSYCRNFFKSKSSISIVVADNTHSGMSIIPQSMLPTGGTGDLVYIEHAQYYDIGTPLTLFMVQGEEK